MIHATKNLFIALWKKRIVFCLMLLTICNGLFLREIQAQQLPNYNLGNMDTVACWADSTQMIRAIPHWEAYQTLDNTWNGVKDSSLCLNYGREDWAYDIHVNLSEIDPDRSLFVRCQLDEENKVLLEENKIYGVRNFLYGTRIWVIGNFTLNTSDTCTNDFCSGLLVDVQVPNEEGDGFTLKNYKYGMNNHWSGSVLANPCFATERFEESNFIREFVFKFTLASSNFEPNDYIRIPAGIWLGGELTMTHDTLYANSYNSNTQHYEFDFDWYYWNLLLYTASTYPKPGNPSYVDVYPSESTGNVETIDLKLYSESTLLAQPYTFLRGGLVNDSDTLRHQFNVINEGGNLCLLNEIELVFEDGNQYHYKSGKVDLQGANACMQFGKGSSLNVADGSTLEYGKYGQGILMLRSGGGIEIGKDAELIVGNKLMMQEYANDVPQQIYMTLNQGSRLTFTETARISNEYSINRAMRLNVYMKGGILDDSALDAQSRALINRIYDTPTAEKVNNLVIYQNPISSGTALQWSSIFDQNETTQVQLFDITGRLVYQNRMETQQGINYFTLPTNDLQSGTYFLSVLVDGEMVTKKVVIYQ